MAKFASQDKKAKLNIKAEPRCGAMSKRKARRKRTGLGFVREGIYRIPGWYKIRFIVQ